MAISDKVKALLKLQGKTNKGLAEYLKISDQALSNKFYRDSYSGEDIILIAEYLECEIAFITGTTKISLSAEDIKKKVKPEKTKKKSKSKNVKSDKSP